MTNEQYYTDNTKYSAMLESQDFAMFEKYTDFVEKLSLNVTSVLDVGCGTGLFISAASKRMPNNHFSGVDISNTSIKVCREKDLDCREYDGKHLPYPDASFDIVGSINVLEHVDDPAAFLNELLRVLKPGGHLITACPNFLAVTNGYHHHTRGYLQKIKNIHGLLSRLLARQPKWEKMQTISRVDFHADDDACNVTNPVDILRWGRNRFLTKVHWSSQTIYRKGILNMLDRIAPFRLILGSSFIVFRK